MALIGIVFFFTLPRFEGSFFLDDSKQSARFLMGKLRALREESLRTRRQLTLHIDLVTNRLWETAEAMTLEELDLAARRNYRLPGGALVAGVEFPVQGLITTGITDIRFYRDGHSDKAMIRLRHGDAYQSFLLEPFLSEVKMFDGLLGFEDMK
jgi:hypothetical protein